MELFPDEAHVRLQSRRNGHYLSADENGVEASWSQHRASLNAAWAVHRVVRHGRTFVLLRGGAYGRYLCYTRRGARRGYRILTQRSYTTLRKHGVMWEASDSEDGTGDVVLRNRKCSRLRTSWIVEAIPPREDPPELPEVAPPPRMPDAPMRVRTPPVLRRRICYMRADDQAELDALVWSRLRFNGRSVSNLSDELAAALGEANSQNITLCVQAGYRARLTPLVIDLPDNERTMEIVVFTTGSEAAQALVYPDVDAQ
ncbi:unnamed protein product [Urochloa decumbens]|uniref:DUF569 domain-containing protein n=1 Tax=Urochloa decumbens TaxID=240449 RepID=A0ABC9DUG0_9POAL